MSRFQECLALIISDEIEGGWTDDPDDLGGATNRGITLEVYSKFLGLPVSSTLKNRLRYKLTAQEIEAIYRQRYWDLIRGDDLPVGLDLCVFDWAVNSGVGRPIPYLQAILGVTADGKIGPITLRYIKEKMSAKLIVRFIDARLEYLKTRPNYWKFKGGWVKRCSIIKAAALKAFEAQQLASNG